jgi:hypothetical protein
MCYDLYLFVIFFILFYCVRLMNQCICYLITYYHCCTMTCVWMLSHYLLRLFYYDLCFKAVSVFATTVVHTI